MQSNAQVNASPSSEVRFHNKYRIVMFAACLNLTLLVVGFVVMITCVVPQSITSKSGTNEHHKPLQTLQFAPLHTFPLLPITEFQEIDTVIVPVTKKQHERDTGVLNDTYGSPFQRLYRVEAVDQFGEAALTRLFLSMGHILDISPSSANLYDEKNQLLSNIRFFWGEQVCTELPGRSCNNQSDSPPTQGRQLTFNRGGRNTEKNSNERNGGDDADAADDESNEKDGPGRAGHRLRIRDGSNMAVLSEAAAQGGVVIDASLIEISDVVDGLGTLSGDFGSLGIQGVNGLGGVTGVANGINDFATVTNGLGGVTPIGNSLLGERNVQPGRTFMSVQSIPTVDMTQTGVSTIPTLSYSAVQSTFTVPTYAVTTVPWGVNYLPSTWSSPTSTHIAANIICADNLCYSIVS